MIFSEFNTVNLIQIYVIQFIPVLTGNRIKLRLHNVYVWMPLSLWTIRKEEFDLTLADKKTIDFETHKLV